MGLLAVVLLVLIALVAARSWYNLVKSERAAARIIRLSPLLLSPSTNKYDVMRRMRATAAEQRSSDVVIFPEGHDEEVP